MMWDFSFDPLLTGVGLVVGILIGATGIGGLFLPPGVNVLADVPLQTAISASVFTFMLTGAAGTAIYVRKTSIAWRDLGPIALGASPAALIGSLMLVHIPGQGIQLAIAGLAIVSGISALGSSERRARHHGGLATHTLLMIGLIVGFFSAITGTGGPLILLPILLLLGSSPLQAVGLAQAIQIPIGVFATSGNLMIGNINMGLTSLLALTVVTGTVFGAIYAHKLPIHRLKTIIAVVMILVGVVYGVSSGGLVGRV